MKLRSRSIRREVTPPAHEAGHKKQTSSPEIKPKSKTSHKDFKTNNKRESRPPRTRSAVKIPPVNSSGSRKKEIPRKLIKFAKHGRVAPMEDIKPKVQFHELPTEMRFKILGNLSTEDKKTASLVCKEWKAECRKNFHFNPPHMNDRTYKTLGNTHYEFEEVTVTNLKDINFPAQLFRSFRRGSQIHTLTFLKPNVTRRNMSALGIAFPNIQTLRIDFTGNDRSLQKRYNKFLTQDLYFITSLLGDLTQVEINFGKTDFLWDVTSLVFTDCPQLQELKVKMEMSSLGSVYFTGFANRSSPTKLHMSVSIQQT